MNIKTYSGKRKQFEKQSVGGKNCNKKIKTETLETEEKNGAFLANQVKTEIGETSTKRNFYGRDFHLGLESEPSFSCKVELDETQESVKDTSGTSGRTEIKLKNSPRRSKAGKVEDLPWQTEIETEDPLWRTEVEMKNPLCRTEAKILPSGFMIKNPPGRTEAEMKDPLALERIEVKMKDPEGWAATEMVNCDTLLKVRQTNKNINVTEKYALKKSSHIFHSYIKGDWPARIRKSPVSW